MEWGHGYFHYDKLSSGVNMRRFHLIISVLTESYNTTIIDHLKILGYKVESSNKKQVRVLAYTIIGSKTLREVNDDVDFVLNHNKLWFHSFILGEILGDSSLIWNGSNIDVNNVAKPAFKQPAPPRIQIPKASQDSELDDIMSQMDAIINKHRNRPSDAIV